MNILIYENYNYSYFIDKEENKVLIRSKYKEGDFYFTMEELKDGISISCKCYQCSTAVQYIDSKKVYDLAKKYLSLL